MTAYRNVYGQVLYANEAAFQADVIDTLRTIGYLATSIRRSDGITIGDVGVPDVFAVHKRTGARVIIELKMMDGILTAAQAAWIDALAIGAPGTGLVGVVTPESWLRYEREVCVELARGSRVDRHARG